LESILVEIIHGNESLNCIIINPYFFLALPSGISQLEEIRYYKFAPGFVLGSKNCAACNP
jgi:hypothetical protein